MAEPIDKSSSATSSVLDPATLRDLEWSLRKPRSLFSYAMSMLTGAADHCVCCSPLFSVLFLLAEKGIEGLTFTAFTTLPPAAMSPGGGFGNALIGTLIIVVIATLISVPVGLFAAIYITEFAPVSRTSKAVRFAAKVLTGLPSILGACIR